VAVGRDPGLGASVARLELTLDAAKSAGLGADDDAPTSRALEAKLADALAAHQGSAGDEGAREAVLATRTGLARILFAEVAASAEVLGWLCFCFFCWGENEKGIGGVRSASCASARARCPFNTRQSATPSQN